MIRIKNFSKDIFIKYPNDEFGIKLDFIYESYKNNNNNLELIVEFDDSYYCEDILKLMMILDRVVDKSYNNILIHYFNIKICFNYIPFSREDREENGRLCTFNFIVNYLFLKNIEFYVDDLHSDKIIKSDININLFPIKDYDVIIFPDEGSFKKYGKYIDSNNKYYIVCNKVRNKETGELEKSDIIHSNIFNKDNYNLKCLIIDDICSYGNTFKMIPKNPKWTYDLFTIYNEGLINSIEGINNIKFLHRINFNKKE